MAENQTSKHPVFDLLPPIFRDCVDEEHHRYSLELPFEMDGHIYATDGRIMVRVAATKEVCDALPSPDDRKFPKHVADLFVGRDRWETEPVPTPTLDGLDRCPHCEGTGLQTCPCCQRHGAICSDCHGTKVDLDKHSSVAVAEGVSLNPIYLGILLKHQVELFVPRPPFSDEIEVVGAVRPVRFEVEPGVEGLLMPMCKPKASRPSEVA
ncbi:hypothetical protein [Singulisphaera sp. PoT]|uniref:hypothetical protein n=1 Tax=Singulisphaera sp. PoT TaxID=3411797 RepID=UPI003BF56D96